MRVGTVIVSAAAILLVAGCTRLPALPDEIVNSLEDEHVRIVERYEASNPTENWMYTYVMFEVTPRSAGAESVASMLRNSGWTVEDSNAGIFRAELVEQGNAYPSADLILFDLDEFIQAEPYPGEERERFSRVPTTGDRAYFAAILTPLRGLDAHSNGQRW